MKELKKLKDLEKLKNSIFNRGGNWDNIMTYVEVMKVVGGYKQLMEMPYVALNEVINAMIRIEKYKLKKLKKK